MNHDSPPFNLYLWITGTLIPGSHTSLVSYTSITRLKKQRELWPSQKVRSNISLLAIINKACMYIIPLCSLYNKICTSELERQ